MKFDSESLANFSEASAEEEAISEEITEEWQLSADEADKSDPQEMQAETIVEKQPLSVGAQLRLARETKNLSVKEVARMLKLSPHQVEAMEDDKWSKLPCPTIVRGFVRNYARILELNPGEMMAVLDGLLEPHVLELRVPNGAPVNNIYSYGKILRRDYVKMASGLMVLLLAILAYFLVPQDWWQSTFDSATTKLKFWENREHRIAARSLITRDSAPSSKLARPLAPVVDTEGVRDIDSVAQSAEVSTSEQGADEMPAQPLSPNALTFSFAESSWLEVRDREGRLLLSRIVPANTREIIEGRPPYSVVIGNAAHATLIYRGEYVDLSRRSREGVARITLP